MGSVWCQLVFHCTEDLDFGGDSKGGEKREGLCFILEMELSHPDGWLDVGDEK